MSNVTYDFSNRVAVVTGGSVGIGAAIAQFYLKFGAKVAIWDLNVPDFAREYSEDQLTYSKVDVSDLASIHEARDHVIGKFGKIDIVSHNAGFAGPTTSVEDYDPAMFHKVINVNLIGSFNVAHALTSHFKQNGYGRLINMASLAGKEGTPNASAYSASKAGVIAFTKSLSKELTMGDIRVNSVAPAAVATAILDQMTPEFVQIMIDKSPLKRLGEVEEVAELVMWLSSDACSFNTGAVFDLSGGRATY